MTLAEFKAWLEGFEHSFAEEGLGAPAQKVPSANQWAQVKEKLALVGLTASWQEQPKDKKDWYDRAKDQWRQQFGDGISKPYQPTVYDPLSPGGKALSA